MTKRLLLWLVAVTPAFGQPLRIQQLGLGTGLSLGAVRNEGVSQLIQRGKGFPFQLYFLSQGSRSRHFLQLQSATYPGGLSSGFAGNSIELATGYLHYGYHRRVAQWGEWSFWPGGTLTMQAINAAYTARLFNSTYRNSQSQTMLGSLGVSALLTRSVGRGRLEGQVGVSVISYNLRPDYAYDSPDGSVLAVWRQRGTWEGFPTFRQLSARLAYDAYVSPRVRLRLDYQWQYWQATRPRHTGMLTNQFIASFAYQFPKV